MTQDTSNLHVGEPVLVDRYSSENLLVRNGCGFLIHPLRRSGPFVWEIGVTYDFDLDQERIKLCSNCTFTETNSVMVSHLLYKLSDENSISYELAYKLGLFHDLSVPDRVMSAKDFANWNMSIRRADDW